MSHIPQMVLPSSNEEVLSLASTMKPSNVAVEVETNCTEVYRQERLWSILPLSSTSLTLVHLSTLVSCRVLFLHCEVVLPPYPPHHPQLVLTWAATSSRRHNLPPKISMHHQHVVAGLWSCTTSVALGEWEPGDGEGGQEEQTGPHFHCCQCSACVSIMSVH